MDQKLLFLINREWTSPALDRLMALLSNFEVWFWPMLLLAIGLWTLGGFTGRAFLITAALVAGINDGLISNPLKRLVNRPRPFQSHSDVRLVDLAKARPRVLAAFKPLKIKMSRSTFEEVKGRSFPSSHTVNCIGVAVVCTAFYRRLGFLAFIPALLVGYSRIYTGSHWPGDIVTSMFLGVGSSLLLLAAGEAAWRRFGPRLFPGTHSAHPRLFAP